jgi:UDP-glucose 4-epimerase
VPPAEGRMGVADARRWGGVSPALDRLGRCVATCFSRFVKALVTGGAGFIGSHLTDALVAGGHEVHVVDNLSSGRIENLEAALARGAELHVEDVTDAAWMADLAGIVRPDVVFHLAAQIDVRRSVDDPTFDAGVNVTGTAAVLDAAHRCGAGRIVLASTAAVYGRPCELPTTEASPVAPISPYGASKAAAEAYLGVYGRLHGTSTLALRMANVYGSRQDPHSESGVVAIFSAAAIAGYPAIVFGDGLQSRDYVHVSDVVAAFMAAAVSPATGVFNISTGRETSVVEIAEGLGLAVQYAPRRTGEIERSCLDPSAARRELGWEARTPLRDGLRPLRVALAA